jgi:hypothetical protein
MGSLAFDWSGLWTSVSTEVLTGVGQIFLVIVGLVGIVVALRFAINWLAFITGYMHGRGMR